MSRMPNTSFPSQHVSLVYEDMPWPTQKCCGYVKFLVLPLAECGMLDMSRPWASVGT